MQAIYRLASRAHTDAGATPSCKAAPNRPHVPYAAPIFETPTARRPLALTALGAAPSAMAAAVSAPPAPHKARLLPLSAAAVVLLAVSCLLLGGAQAAALDGASNRKLLQSSE